MQSITPEPPFRLLRLVAESNDDANAFKTRAKEVGSSRWSLFRTRGGGVRRRDAGVRNMADDSHLSRRTEPVQRGTGLEQQLLLGFIVETAQRSNPGIVSAKDIFSKRLVPVEITPGQRYMANNHQMNEDMEADIEIKVEPAPDYGDDDNENGFVGFDNTNTIPSATEVGTLNLWTSHATACLISQYKKYHNMVGQTLRIRSFREMFETISLEMQKYGFYFSPQKCENKWRVLERKYKNLVFRERLKKPGRIRHYGHWEHKRALDEIFNEKKRHMYLDESDFPPPSGSAKFVQKALREAAAANAKASQVCDDSPGNPCPAQRQFQNGQKASLSFFETFLSEMNKNFAQAESNRERRHKEQMAIRQSELEVSRKLLQLKERKMELKMNQMNAAAQYFNLNTE